MSVLVYIDTLSGSVSKAAMEAVYYGSKIGSTTVLTNGGIAADQLAVLGECGASKVLVNRAVTVDDASQVSKLVVAAVEATGADTVVMPLDLTGRAVAPRVSARLKAGLATGAVALPAGDGTIKVNVFSGKAFGNVSVKTAKKVITLTPNSLQIEKGGAAAAVEDFNAEVGGASITVKEVRKQEGDILLPEAELVVSAGRGLKGPENWGIVEDLAKALGAATACSRPVADIGWRPHHEHVGQTGVAIRPNLYIAAGISGAIQHLAGVNGSKVIVVINTDPEAPFFKAADYGVVGDAFEVLPKLTAEIEKFKAQN
ncbi:electron transfer flavoprotein subunit alpha/FixB family protein [Paracrocinitomix mangrovi]|uniref:electron transfer flavoprotein subunit alpha/FixB family protein n=1 Tax=Paracrocinitomix mangrovi TaxID=2862509 RepID=UPI001C8E5405|nr:electron transfer flavoprotein subunit alpha/FixB family protein [Paracrocinitomix mangrovi]UKN00508.1 electron transfer flavoprotein subunit alpha/FixB family protein [Paracrocinitomix mangrovi]